MVLAQRRPRFSQIYDQVCHPRQRRGLKRSMRRDNLAVGNTMSTQKLACQCWVLGGDAQTSPLVRGVVSCQVPQIGASTDIDPGLRDGHNQATAPVTQVALQYNKIIVKIVFVALLVAVPTMLGQYIITGDPKRGIAILHQ